MNGNTAVAEVQQILGFRSDLVQNIVNALNYAQVQRETPGHSLPWFLLQEEFPIATVALTSTIDLPTGFLKEQEFDAENLMYISTTGARFFLKKGGFVPNWEFFNGAWQGELSDPPSIGTTIPATGVPRRYQLRKSKIYLFPVPDQVYALYWNFYKSDDPVVNAASTNQWLTYAPWLLIGGAAAYLAADIKNADALAKAQAIAQMGERDLIAGIAERDLAGGALAMGSRL